MSTFRCRKAADTDQLRFFRFEEGDGGAEIVERRMPVHGSGGSGQFMDKIGGDKSTNTRACGKKQRQGFQSRKIFLGTAPVEIAVENNIGGTGLVVAQQIHDEEGQVVENIYGGNLFAELDGIEKNRPAVEDDDVGAMHVAMAATYKPPSLRRLSSGRRRCNEFLVQRMELGRFGSRRTDRAKLRRRSKAGHRAQP